MNQVKATYPVLGMSCASCAARVDKTLNALDGVMDANVNYASASALITYDGDCTSAEVLQQAVRDAGYDLFIGTDKNEADEQRARSYRSLRRRMIAAVCLALPMMVFGMLCMDWPYTRYVLWVLSTPVVFVFGRQFFIGAWRQLRHGTSNMDTLVACSTGIAYLFSLFNLFFPQVFGAQAHVYFESAAGIIAFILIGRTLEASAKNHTSTAIRKLMGLQPNTVTMVVDGKDVIRPIAAVAVGDRLRVKPGERIAVDGTVMEGDSYIDESMLSGEPIAVHKSAGKAVYAGTINQKGSFVFQARKVGTDTMLAQIIRTVQEAQGSKAPVQQLVDKVAAVFVPTIIILSVITLVAWLLLAPADGFIHGLLAMVTVLIIACPCALGLATPTAIMVGIGKGAELGILIKDAESLEIAKNIDIVVLDKTGTLTEGHPAVTDRLWMDEDNRNKSVLYSIEHLSEHPLAEAVDKELEGADLLSVSHFISIPGKGVMATVDDVTYYVGNEALLKDNGIVIDKTLLHKAQKWATEAKTVVWFADASKAIAVLAISDHLKSSSAAAVAQLREMGITAYMLTGDSADSAREIARQTGITHFHSGVLPQYKADFVKQLQSEGHRVAMVGDGINDSAALAQADLSIAMGQGSDIAMETAMVTILRSDLCAIATAIHLSKATVRTIHENLFWAFIYNLIAVPIAAGVLYPAYGFLLNPMIGGAAMAFSSVSVVLNSLRLKTRRVVSSLESFTQDGDGTHGDVTDYQSITDHIMKKEFKVSGMMCQHCRAHVENALNSIEGVKAVVTLEPAVASVEFTGAEKSLEELQQVVSEKAGSDYILSL